LKDQEVLRGLKRDRILSSFQKIYKCKEVDHLSEKLILKIIDFFKNFYEFLIKNKL
jgi:hypothetical protein